MKIYRDNDEGKTLIIGKSEEICAVEKSLRRSMKKQVIYDYFYIVGAYRHNLAPMFINQPKFSPGKIYGLLIDERGYWHILSASQVLMELELV